jgi:hypothetical protein
MKTMFFNQSSMADVIFRVEGKSSMADVIFRVEGKSSMADVIFRVEVRTNNLHTYSIYKIL